MSSSERLKDAIGELRKGQTPVDLAPKTAYEVMTRAQVDDLQREFIEFRGRMTTLIFGLVATIVGAVVLGVLRSLGVV